MFPDGFGHNVRVPAREGCAGTEWCLQQLQLCTGRRPAPPDAVGKSLLGGKACTA